VNPSVRLDTSNLQNAGSASDQETSNTAALIQGATSPLWYAAGCITLFAMVEIPYLLANIGFPTFFLSSFPI
jgi:hypothetical protein